MTAQQKPLAHEAILKRVEESMMAYQLIWSGSRGPKLSVLVGIMHFCLELLEEIDLSPEHQELVASRLLELSQEADKHQGTWGFSIKLRETAGRMRLPAPETTPTQSAQAPYFEVILDMIKEKIEDYGQYTSFAPHPEDLCGYGISEVIHAYVGLLDRILPGLSQEQQEFVANRLAELAEFCTNVYPRSGRFEILLSEASGRIKIPVPATETTPTPE